jgi:uncharacterized protein (TIGR02099 family)
MKSWLQKLFRIIAYTMAGVIILLAIVVGLFRLLLPKLPEYQEEIKQWTSEAIGAQVEFAGMNARWRFRGPELNFYEAELITRDDALPLIDAREVSVGINLFSLLLDRKLVVDDLYLQSASVTIATNEQGEWLIQGMPLSRLQRQGTEEAGGQALDKFVVIAEDVSVQYERPGATETIPFYVERARAELRTEGFSVDASVAVPADMGASVEVAGSWMRAAGGRAESWQLFIESSNVDLSGWSRFLPGDYQAPLAGSGSISVWVEFAEGQLRSSTANFLLSEFRVGDLDSGWPAVIEGGIEFSRTSAGWVIAANKVRLSTGAGDWPQSDMQLEIGRDMDGLLQSVEFDASYVNLDDLAFVLPWLPTEQAEAYERFRPGGIVKDLDVYVSGIAGPRRQFQVQGRLENAGISFGEDKPGIRNFSGSLRANQTGGRLEIQATDLQVDYDKLYDRQLTFENADGTVIWRRNRNGLLILSDRIQVQSGGLAAQSSLQLNVPGDGTSPFIDLDSRWTLADLSQTHRYLPRKVMRERTYKWVVDALMAGRVTRGVTRLTGPLRAFPFDGGEGQFRVEASIADAELNYSGRWPNAQRMDLELVVDRMRLYTERNSSVTEGSRVVNARIAIADLREPVLTIDAKALGTLDSLQSFVRNSPISNVFGDRLDSVSLAGEATLDLDLDYPILSPDDYTFNVGLRSTYGTVRVDGLKAPVTELTGMIRISRDDISSENLTAEFLGRPVALSLGKHESELHSVRLDVAGDVTAEALITEMGLPFENFISGETPYVARLNFPRREVEQPVDFTIDIDSELQGMAILLPNPMAKSAGISAPTHLEILFPAEGRLDLHGRSGELSDWYFSYLEQDGELAFDRGSVVVGGDRASLPENAGLYVSGKAAAVRLDDWLNLSEDEEESSGLVDEIEAIELQLDDFYAYGQHLIDHSVRVQREPEDWLVNIDGDQVAGTMSVPFDFTGDRPLRMNMSKLILQGGDEAASEQGDPREMPAAIVQANEFGLGTMRFGKLNATITRTPEGVSLDSAVTQDPSFGFTGSGRWVVDLMDETGQRSYLAGKVTGTDVDAAMKKLGFDPGINGSRFEFDLDLSWSGGPTEDYLSSLDGEVRIDFGTGQLKEVEPGAGRVFGLMSIVALPRRLALDFRDVFQKGLGFDAISGSFRVVNGTTYTCDLSLNGPAVAIGVVGRAGLVTRDYNQAAIVSANFGSALPVVGAVVAGPQVAAAMLIFSQIFKKPLDELGQVYYKVGGSWDEPMIEVSDAQRFAAVSDLAGCLATSE